MGYTAITCPQCGAPITSMPDKGSFFCQYCGAKIEKEKQLIEVSGNVTIAGMASVESLLDRAFMFLEERDYENADKYLERVLDANPKCAKAYIGKLLVKKQYANTNELTHHYNYQLERNELFKKALRFANDDEYDELMALKEANIQQHNQNLHNVQVNINQANKNLYDFNQYFSSHKFSYNKYMSLISIDVLLMVIAIMGLLFGIVGLIAAGPLGLIFVIPFSGALAGTIVWERNLKKKRAEGEKLEQEQKRLQDLVDSRYHAEQEIEKMWNSYDTRQ